MGSSFAAAAAAFLRFRRPTKKNRPAINKTPATTPMTMPAIAPPERDELDEELVLAAEVVVAVAVDAAEVMVEEVEVVMVEEVDVVVDVAGAGVAEDVEDEATLLETIARP